MSRFYSELQIVLRRAKALHKSGFLDEPPADDSTDYNASNRPSSAAFSLPGNNADSRLDLQSLVHLAPAAAIQRLNELINQCTKCQLCRGRTKAVPGTGVLAPKILVVGEGPGADEDRLGLPFVGAAGQYLDKWLEAIGLSRYQNCHIANVVKCRPPQNRDPQPAEIAACTPYLQAQIQVLRPKAILVVGRVAAGYLLGRSVKMGEVRGQFFQYKQTPFMATFHPAAVLRDQSLRQSVWDDLKLFRSKFLEA